ncbi:MAG: uracil-DNA glycosylase family protein [Anaeromyxobacter sp.]
MPACCPGYVSAPFQALVQDYPDEAVYPPADFRTEWGPIFHRGRLDGSARVLVLGQDPGQHENVLRRILVGEAGRRVQGLLARLGVTRSYVLLNALLYSVYGSKGAKYVARPGVRAYRDAWIEGVLATSSIEAVITFGGMARKAWEVFAAGNAPPAGLVVQHLTHPTFPESAGGTAAEKRANTRKLLQQWSAALRVLHPAIAHPDLPAAPAAYGERFEDGDKADIPAADLPPGIPRWMFDEDGWARRVGATVAAKRRNITLTVPEGVIAAPQLRRRPARPAGRRR